MLKKMMLLASMSLAAVALAAPAAAQAEWLDNGEPLTADKTMTVSGFLAFGNPEAGQTSFGCVIHATVTLKPAGSTSQVTKFEVTTETCKGVNQLEGCVLESHTNTTPWTVDANTAAGTVTITGATVTNKYKAGTCKSGATTSHIDAPSITLTPDNRFSISSFKAGLYGFATSGAAIFSPTGLTVTPAKTFGISE